jgi:hypothetical protein
VPIANLSFVGSENLLALLQRFSREKDRDYTLNLINSQVVPSYTRDDLPALALYRKLMDRYDPKPPADLVSESYQNVRYSFVSLEGFLDARLVVEVLRKMGKNLSRARLRETAESLGEVHLGLETPVILGPNRHQAMNQVYYSVVDKGQFGPLHPADWKRWRK